ncbi:hypothetical protein [Nitrosospira sp. NRS527]|uniref:hypothetical protein n=1 Tax=Nitrosospira sp. NRS527 TaxID=155925 RepID=UPI001BCF6BCF|nr:hypothetical protein [Nitrosospira sp. NRS527]
MISIAALNGLARNIAQKRDFFSDPLCTEALWKKTYHAGHDLPHESTLPEKIKTVKGKKAFRPTLNHLANKILTPGYLQERMRMFEPEVWEVCNLC